MSRARIAILEVSATPQTKSQGEAEKAKLLDNADKISGQLDAIEDGLDEDSVLADDKDGEEEELSEDEEETPEDKVARHKKKWAKRKAKYQKYCDKGKVEKLEKVKAKQQQKLEKAKAEGKPTIYIEYKQFKVDYTSQLLVAARLIHNLKKAGLIG